MGDTVVPVNSVDQKDKTPTDENKEIVAPSSDNESTPTSLPPSYDHVIAETLTEAEQAGATASEQKTAKTPEKTKQIVVQMSDKDIWKAAAAQWRASGGCTLKESCKCWDCQSRYFESEYDESEHNKTDGGLGAGTPMFISELMHGSTCSIL